MFSGSCENIAQLQSLNDKTKVAMLASTYDDKLGH